MWSDLYSDLDVQVKMPIKVFRQPSNKKKKAATMAVAEAAPVIKNLVLVNYTSGGPYGQASQRDRWTEYHNKKPSIASQLPDGLRTGGCRLTKCHPR